MSRPFSRLLLSSRLLKGSANKIKPKPFQQSQLNYSQSAKSSKPGEGKGPITWKSLSVAAVGGAALLGILKYIQIEKDLGKIEWC